MDESTDILTQTATTFQEVASDPGRLVLFLGPLAVFILLLLVILFLRIANRRKEAAIMRAALDSEKATATETLAHEPSDVPRPTAFVEVATPPLPQDVSDIRNLDQSSWLRRLHDGLKKTRDNLGASLNALFSKKMELTPEIKEKLHEVLFRADLGVSTAQKLVSFVEQDSKGEAVDWEQVKAILKHRVSELLSKVQKPFNHPDSPPFVILIVGVNGVGKTTTVAKLAASYLAEDRTVLLCAADTYRAAAIDQLKVWGERLGVDVIAHQQGSDPAAVAYDAVKAAIARKVDVLIIDTAGRLHSKKELMDELAKINRVVGKDKPGAPHETWLVVDATTGQNALMQIKAFKEVVQLSGLVVTKLDGTAKGGVLVAAVDQYQLPIHYVGVGEKSADLRPFAAEDYADSLL